MDTETVTVPRVWIGCLAAYNAGMLHGEWVEVTSEPDDLYGHIERVLAASPIRGAEEWAFMDSEGFPRGFAGESSSPEELAAWVLEVEDAEEAGPGEEVLAAYWDNDQGQEVEGIAERCRDAFMGEHRSLGDFAHELEEESGELEAIPDRLRFAIDWERLGRDLELGGDVFTADAGGGCLYVFWNA